MDRENKNKKIVFESNTHKHAQLKIRLEYDKDIRILKFIDSYKAQKGKDSKRNTKYREKDLQKGDDLLQKFGIKDTELDNIFDLIEEEFPDL
jgi:hypothetical protein